MTIAFPETTDAPEAETPGKRPPLWRLAAKAGLRMVVWTLVAAFSAGFLALVIEDGIAPIALHAAKKTILTLSMKGTYNPGDVVVIQPQDHIRDYKIGDPVTFQPNSGDTSTYITHRITGISLGNGPGSIDGVAGFTTQGDANNVPDKPIEAGQVMGKVLYSIPLIGYPSNWIASNLADLPLAAIAITVGVGMIAGPPLLLIPWRWMFRRRSRRH